MTSQELDTLNDWFGVYYTKTEFCNVTSLDHSLDYGDM
jgi:hypothetical protein